MAGIYIHVPWCRKVCIYCDFHFSVSVRNKDALLECLLKELEIQKDYLGGEDIESVYFGGGTPSVLSYEEVNRMLSRIKALFNVVENAEITLEANPDDLSTQYLEQLGKAGINRLSIGVQSFHDDDLKWMNRRHDGNMSKQSVENSIKAGFKNISIDLIYGLPGMDAKKWHRNLITALSSGIQHISAYHMTLENKTVYASRVKRGILKKPDEAAGLKQYEMLINMAVDRGFMHYEISNFCLPGYISHHNTSYWLGKPYLGIGPSANSFNRESRQWNIRNNSKYIEEINRGDIPFSFEKLSLNDRYNEYVLTSLRTVWGADIKSIARNFGQLFRNHFEKEAGRLVSEGKLEINNNTYTISQSGKFFADGIISDLFITG